MRGNGGISVDQIESIIFLIRGQKVMLSPHLAELYNIEPRVLVQAVKRNIDRFPGDFIRAKGDGVEFRRFLFYFWSFAKITDIYFVWFIKSFSSGRSCRKCLALFL